MKSQVSDEIRGIVARAIVEAKEPRPPAEAGPAARPAAPAERPETNLDKLRDVLFGTQPYQFEARLARLEEALAKQETHMREVSKRLFESMEAYMKKELECLRDRLKAEREERIDALKLLSRDLRDSSDALSKKIAEIDDHISELLYGQLREEIMQFSMRFGDELQRQQEEVQVLAAGLQQVRSQAANPALFGDVLIELGMRLKNELSLPAEAA